LRREKQAKDFEARRKEEEESRNKLDGRMQIMLCDLQNNLTPIDYSCTGLNLGTVQCRMFAAQVAYNSSLMSLHLARKGIIDSVGVELARMLLTNKTLRKLELEGNLLGLQSAYAFGRALKVNTTLKFLDLESNQLTTDGTVWGGVTSLIEFLAHNKTLLSLNLANNGMDDSCGSNFRELLEDNYTLIDFDFSMNNFTLEDSRRIQDLLMRNKGIYDENRLREWRERKAMRAEDEALKELFL